LESNALGTGLASLDGYWEWEPGALKGNVGIASFSKQSNLPRPQKHTQVCSLIGTICCDKQAKASLSIFLDCSRHSSFNFLSENGKHVLMLCWTNGFRLEQDSQKENMSDHRDFYRKFSLICIAIVITNQQNSQRECKENRRKEVWLQLKYL